MFGIELRIATRGGRVAPKAYRDLVADVEGLVEEIDHVVPGTGLAWGLGHGERHGALVVRLEPLEHAPASDEPRVRQTVLAVVEGAAELRAHSGIPDYYTETGVSRLLDAARRRSAPGVDAVELAALNGTELAAAALDEELIAHAASTVSTSATAQGSVEGVLDTMSTRRKQARASVFDATTRRAVEVRASAITAEDLHRHFGQRVLIGGALTRNGQGQAVRILADHIQALPAIAPRSRLRELIGIAPGWTGGRSTAEVMAELRDRG